MYLDGELWIKVVMARVSSSLPMRRQTQIPTGFSVQLVLCLGGLSTTPQRPIETAASSVQVTIVVFMGLRATKVFYMLLIQAHVASTA